MEEEKVYIMANDTLDLMDLTAADLIRGINKMSLYSGEFFPNIRVRTDWDDNTITLTVMNDEVDYGNSFIEDMEKLGFVFNERTEDTLPSFSINGAGKSAATRVKNNKNI